jgi:polysaccharide export outer membrane protein
MLGLILLCLVYCWIAPNQYEATARVALRMQTASSVSLDTAESIAPASILSTPLQLETLVNVFRSERLAWSVITGMKLYESAAFSKDFATRFAGFDAAHPTPEAQGYLLDRFAKLLKVRALPRTLLIEVRFRSKDPLLAAAVVNRLVQGYMAQENQARVDATGRDSAWLGEQLKSLTAQVEADEKRLAGFEREHGFLSSQQMTPGGQSVETLHDPAVLQVDEAGRLLAAASGERILREALYREAQLGNPEQVLAANPELSAEMAPVGASLVQQLRVHSSEIGVELAQLKAEHGPNFPRVVELGRAQQDISQRITAEDANLLEAFRRSWKAAVDRERLVQQRLDERMAAGVRNNDATLQYAVLRERVEAGRSLAGRLEVRLKEAALSAGVHPSSILVVDAARVPFKPVAPDLPLYLAITVFVGAWIALVGALLLERLRPVSRYPAQAVVCLLVLLVGASTALGQAPTPNTSGLPTGVVRIPIEPPEGTQPNPKTAPPIWNSAAPAVPGPDAGLPVARLGAAMALPIGVGDFLEISESHVPEFRSAVRVSSAGTVVLPMVGEVKLLGLGEEQASKVIEKALVDGGMLLHPQVTVMITGAAGQDVSVLGEVTRPGVYPYTVHHRLLDLISAASGLSPNAGRLVMVTHRDDPHSSQALVLDPSGTDAKVDHNPELAPGDTIVVSRAGLAYVIGDVVRPGGFAVDPVQGLTIVQALSLAWGATPNASVSKAILIRDQPGGRTLTTLNLKRMIRGQDPDQPVRDRDILFVPDSATKSLMNKTLESAIQSAIGVTIYAGLVYSQRF